MRETDLNIRIKLDCENEFEFRERDLVSMYGGEFLLPSTEILDSEDVVQVELVYRDGKPAVLGTAHIIGAGAGGYLAKFVEISLGEIELVEHWDDTVPPGLIPQGMVRQHEEEPKAPKAPRAPQSPRPSARPTQPVPARMDTSEPTSADPRQTAPQRSRRASATSSSSSASRATGKSTRGSPGQRRPRRTSGAPRRSHRLAPVRLTGLPQSPVAAAARARLAARQRRRFLLQTGALALAAVSVVVIIFVMRSPSAETPSGRDTTIGSKPSPENGTGKQGGASDELSAALQLADRRLAEGRIAGPGGDHALDHLLTARKLGPGDPGVQRRLHAIADKYEELAAAAIDDESLEEALSHLRIVVKADPGRERAQTRIKELTEKLQSSAPATP